MRCEREVQGKEPWGESPQTFDSQISLICAEYLDDDLALRTRAIELDQEDALPRAEQQLAVRDGHSLACAEHDLLAVRMTIRTLVIMHVHRAHAEVIVAIVRIRRCAPLQELTQVFEQQRLVFLNTDCGGGVARKYVG